MTHNPTRLTAETLVERLEEAGQTLLSLPDTGYSTRLARTGMIWINDAVGTYSAGHGGAEAGSSGAVPASAPPCPAPPKSRAWTRHSVGSRSSHWTST